MNRSFRVLAVTVAGLIWMSALGGCGGAAEPETADADDGVRTVRIGGDDRMRFDVTEIRAAPGERFRLTLVHTGRMPKERMGHNWVLFARMDAAALNALAMEAAQNPPDYLPRDRSVVLAKTRMLGPRESDTILVEVPEEPGEYVFACTFPGHFALMRGTLVVE